MTSSHPHQTLEGRPILPASLDPVHTSGGRTSLSLQEAADQVPHTSPQSLVPTPGCAHRVVRGSHGHKEGGRGQQASWSRYKPSPTLGREAPESVLCAASTALVGNGFPVAKESGSHSLHQCSATTPGGASDCPGLGSSLDFPGHGRLARPLSIAPAHSGPSPHQSCSFRIPKARGPACVQLRWLKVCARVSHRLQSELSAGELQRRPQKQSDSCPTAKATQHPVGLLPWGRACPAGTGAPSQVRGFQTRAVPSTGGHALGEPVRCGPRCDSCPGASQGKPAPPCPRPAAPRGT